MSRERKRSVHRKEKTPTFLLEPSLVVEAGQATHLGSHLEVGRQFDNAMLSAGHLDAVLGQTLASRAYRALNRICVGKARRVRFKSKQRGLSSIENKRNDTSMRFVLEPGAVGRPQGYLLWHDEKLAARIDWDDPVVAHGLAHPIKYARLVRRRASSPRAHGADSRGDRYYVQLVLQGVPYQKPKHIVGTDTVALDLGPASLAIVPQEAEAHLVPLCAELRPDARAIRRLQRKMDRKLRAANPEHYDEKGRPKKRGKGVAETLWQERGTVCPRDVDRPPEAHSCKDWRHPARGPHTHV